MAKTKPLSTKARTQKSPTAKKAKANETQYPMKPPKRPERVQKANTLKAAKEKTAGTTNTSGRSQKSKVGAVSDKNSGKRKCANSVTNTGGGNPRGRKNAVLVPSEPASISSKEVDDDNLDYDVTVKRGGAQYSA